MQRLPQNLTAGGKTREVTAHLQQRATERPELTAGRITAVLEHWVIRGIKTGKDGERSIAYLGWIEYQGRRRLMRVAVSMDDQRLPTATLDHLATSKYLKGDMDYFNPNYADLESRNETQS